MLRIDNLKSCAIAALLFILFIQSGIYASFKGTVSGIVLDRSIAEPVPGTVVEILETNKFFVANPDGTFELEIPKEGTYRLKFTHIAYRENVIELDVNENTEKNIRVFMVPKAIEINPVVVTDKLPESKFEEISEESLTLKGKELQRELGFNLASTLKNETGLAIRSMGPAPARPVIRGLGGNRVFLSEDGNAATDLSATSPDHAVTIEAFNVEQIEVLRGPKVLLFTPITIGGIVNVVKNEIPEQLQHQVHGNAGFFGESANKGYLGSIVAEIPVDPFSFRVEASKRKSGDLETPKKTLKNSYSDNLNFSTGGTWFFNNGYLGASWRRYELTYGVPGGFVGAHPNGVEIDMFRDQYNIKSGLKFENSIFENAELHLSRVLYRHKEFEYNGLLGSEFRIINYLGYLNLKNKQLGFLNNGTIGISFDSRDFNIGGYVFTPRTKSLNVAAYIFESFAVNRFSFEFGARYNFDDITPQKEKPNSDIGYIRKRTFNTYSLSFSALFEASEHVYFGANISKSSRVPTIEELFSEGPHLAAYSYETGNPDLKAEGGLGSELFIYHKFDDLYFNISFFRNDLYNYIIPRNTGEINYSTFLPIYASTGVTALLYGAEFQADWKAWPFLSLSATGSYTRGKFKGSGNSLPQIPPLKGKVEVRYNSKDIVAGISSEMSARQNKTDEFEEPTAGYVIINSFIQYSLATGLYVHNISLSADNIFNKEYRNHLSRVKSIMPEAGRNFRLTYKLYF
jgi:iron complex outermembrane receptor protein